MTKGSPALLPSPRLAALTTLGLAAAAAWLVALDTAWSRWNALALGPICGETARWALLPGHCAACPLAVALTALLALMLARSRQSAPVKFAR